MVQMAAGGTLHSARFSGEAVVQDKKWFSSPLLFPCSATLFADGRYLEVIRTVCNQRADEKMTLFFSGCRFRRQNGGLQVDPGGLA